MLCKIIHWISVIFLLKKLDWSHQVNLLIIFTGGDAKYFVKRIKNTIFAKYDLVVCGLNRILEYNAKTE